MGKNVTFEWTTDCETSFNYLKTVLSAAPIAALPDFNEAFKVFTDASKEAVGAVLVQVKDGAEHVVAYASQTLNQTQCRWSTFDREMWAAVWAVREFRHCIGLAFFTIITDHRPLLGLRRMALDNDPTGRRSRWILELDPLNWDIVYKDGQHHMNADALSHQPERDCLRDNETCTSGDSVGVNAIHPDPATPIPQQPGAGACLLSGTVTPNESEPFETLSLALGYGVAYVKAQQEADAEIRWFAIG